MKASKILMIFRTQTCQLSKMAVFGLLLLGANATTLRGGTMTDSFAARPRESGRTAVFTGNSRNATRESGEPNHQSSRGRTLWAEWTASAAGWVTMDTLGTTFANPALSVYVGGSFSEMTPIARAGDPDNTGPNPALVRFPVSPGTSYQIVLDGQNALTSNSGDGQVNVRLDPGPIPPSTPGMDAFSMRHVLEGTNLYGIANTEGYSVDAFEPPTLGKRKSTVWWSWRAPSSGRVKLSTEGSYQREGKPLDTIITVFSGPSLPDLTYVAMAADVPNAAWSLAEFYAEEGRVYEILVDGQEAFSSHRGNVLLHLEFEAQLVSDGIPGSDAFANRGRLSGPIALGVGNNAANTVEAFEPAHFGKRNKVAWWEWTASYTGRVHVNTEGTQFFSALTVYTGDKLNNLSIIAGADHGAGTVAASLQFDAVRGARYVIAVDGSAAFSSHAGNIQLNVFQPWSDLYVTQRAHSVRLIAFGKMGHRYGIESSEQFTTWQASDSLRSGKNEVMYWEQPLRDGAAEFYRLLDR